MLVVDLLPQLIVMLGLSPRVLKNFVFLRAMSEINPKVVFVRLFADIDCVLTCCHLMQMVWEVMEVEKAQHDTKLQVSTALRERMQEEGLTTKKMFQLAIDQQNEHSATSSKPSRCQRCRTRKKKEGKVENRRVENEIDGINFEEFKNLLFSSGLYFKGKTARRLFRDVDRNKCRRINFDEFTRFVSRSLCILSMVVYVNNVHMPGSSSMPLKLTMSNAGRVQFQ